MPPSGEALITPARGGKLTVDRVTVEFPPGAVDQDMTLRIVARDLPASPKYARLAYVFDLEARAGQGPQARRISRFRRLPKVTVRYGGLGLSEEDRRRSLITFGRIVAIARPGDSLDKDAYDRYYKATKGLGYYDNSHPYRVLVSTRKIASGPGDMTGYHAAWTFYDGLGREVQQYSDHELGPSPKNIVVNTYYDSRGLKRRETIPHSVPAVQGFDQTDWTGWLNQNQGTGKVGTDIQYDALRRPIRTTNPDGYYRGDCISGLGGRFHRREPSSEEANHGCLRPAGAGG